MSTSLKIISNCHCRGAFQFFQRIKQRCLQFNVWVVTKGMSITQTGSLFSKRIPIHSALQFDNLLCKILCINVITDF